MNIVIIGCGDIGIRCARLLVNAGHRVVGVRRNVESLPQWLPAVEADVLQADTLEFLGAQQPLAIDAVIYVLAAASFNEHAYRDAYVSGLNNVLEALHGRELKRFFYVSSTGVYHQNDGSVVDEDSPTEPVRFNGQIVLEGEEITRSRGEGTCVRFSGIYGPERTRLINRVAAGQVAQDANPAYTNRIHVEDCAGVLAHLVSLAGDNTRLEDLYLSSDNLPATNTDVETFIAQELGLSLKGSEPVPRSGRLAGSKRCNNQRLRNSGYHFQYPDYKSGYRQIIASMRSAV